MTTTTDTPLFSNPARQRPCNGGEQRLYEFPNGWGASVVRHQSSYGGDAGLWELAVTEGLLGDLSYSTPITSDVLGHLTEAEVDATLAEIAALPARVAS